MAVFDRSFDLTASLEQVWRFHSDPAALARITPKPLTLIPDGTRVTDHVKYEMPLGALGRIADAIGVRFWSAVAHKTGRLAALPHPALRERVTTANQRLCLSGYVGCLESDDLVL